MRGFLVLGAILLAQGTITCLHIRDLRVPPHVAEGSEAVLGCRFDLQGQRLYAVRWLKDDREFYNFKPGRGSPPRHFPVQGVSVDASEAGQDEAQAQPQRDAVVMNISDGFRRDTLHNPEVLTPNWLKLIKLARSGLSWVTLVFLSRESAGEYACELTGEGPHYRTAVAKKNITVDLLPERDPQVVGVREYYGIDEPLELNCTSLGARPISYVTWLINNEPAPHYHLRGPWHTRSASRLGAIDTTRELSFGLRSLHFVNGIMTLKCRATLPPLYEREVEIRYQMLKKARQAWLLEATTQPNDKTTEAPCTSTIKIQVEESSNHLEPWPVTVTDPPKETTQTPRNTALTKNSADILFVCALLVTFF